METHMRPSIGAVIAAEAMARGLGVRELARLSGKSVSTIQRLIGGTDAQVSTLLAVLGVLGRGLRWLEHQGITPPQPECIERRPAKRSLR